MEARVKTLERENKALHEGYAALLKAMGKGSSAFAQCVERSPPPPTPQRRRSVARKRAHARTGAARSGVLA